MMNQAVSADKYEMVDSSISFAIAAGVALCAAVFSTTAWLRSRRRLNECLEEWKALKKSSNLFDIERQVVNRMNHGASLKEVLDILTESIEGMAPQCFCSVLLLDEEQKHLWEGSRGGLPEAYMRAVDGLAIGPEVGACGSAAYRNETIVVEDIATDPRFATVKDFVMSFGLLACWSVPIRGSNQNVLGTFAMYHRHRAKPKERELRIVEVGAQLAGNAIERLRASEKLKENEERIILAEKAAFLGIWELDIAHDILTLSQELATQVGFPDAAHQLNISQLRSMVHPDDWQGILTGLEQASPAGKLFHAEFRVVLDNGLVRWLRTQARVDFVENKPRRMIGVSVDITKEKDLVEELHFLAAHDSLTGVWNRRAIFDLMNREFEMAARLGTTTGVMMLDLDHFKHVNDTYGHPAGDVVLKESVQRLQMALRSYDLIGRYGGEEFLVVFPRCGEEQVRECAERVCVAIAREPFVADGVPIQMTVSVGTTVVDSTVSSEQEALATADAAMYHAKAGGRNRTVFKAPAKARRDAPPALESYSI
jgi:diguanylate cyclase (GGDEF)-like protein